MPSGGLPVSVSLLPKTTQSGLLLIQSMRSMQSMQSPKSQQSMQSPFFLITISEMLIPTEFVCGIIVPCGKS